MDKGIEVVKHAETSKNRIIIPISFIKKVGREFVMEIHNDYLVLKAKNDKNTYIKKEN